MTSRRWQIAHYTYLALLFCLLIVGIFTSVCACRPILAGFKLQAVADVSDPRTIKCANSTQLSLATRTAHILTDWLLLPVPIIIIWRLQMPLSKKIRFMMAFCLGLVSSVATVVRNVLTTRQNADLTCMKRATVNLPKADTRQMPITRSTPGMSLMLSSGASLYHCRPWMGLLMKSWRHWR